jgi:cobalt-zinc-cadmium efflux system outer membrane protein
VADIARERFAAGSAPRVDEVRTRGERARARAEAAAALTAIAGASARLAVWLGAAPGTPWRTAGAAALGPLPSESEALEHLSAQHPTLRRDRAQAEAAKRHVRAEQRLRWPIVTAQVSVAQGDPTLPATDVAAGLAFEAPVLSLRGGAIARARAEQALAEANADIDLRRLAAQLDDAYRASEGAALRARALEGEVLPALEEARRMTEDGYRDGRIDLLRVIDAQRAALDARLAALDARATWQHALADLERAIGATREGGP